MSIELSCDNNRLTLLPEHLPNSLTTLYCNNNLLTLLPEQLPNSLETLSCVNNRLTRLPEHLPNSLKYFYCRNNTFLFNLKNNLKWINLNDTSFTNYRILWNTQKKKKVVLQKRPEDAQSPRILSGVHSVNFQKRSESAPKESASQIFQNYMNRDLGRECSKY